MCLATHRCTASRRNFLLHFINSGGFVWELAHYAAQPEIFFLPFSNPERPAMSGLEIGIEARRRPVSRMAAAAAG
jgi:hypothetical protein